MIIIDFDDTLFDTQQYIRDILALFVQHGVSVEDARAAMKSLILTEHTQVYNYTFEHHLESLQSLGYALPTRVLLHALKALTQKTDYSFSDTVSFLERLSALGQRVILLSAGNESFQRMKYESTQCPPFFDEAVFVQSHKEEYVASVYRVGEPLFFINDKSPENEAVKRLCPHAIVITKHNPYKAVGDHASSMSFPTFDSLLDIATYIETYDR